MTFAANGNVGIGTASPSATLHVVGGAKIGANAYTAQTGDIGTSRDGAPATGIVYFGNTGGHYIYWDGAYFNFTAPINAPSYLNMSGGVTVQTAPGRALGTVYQNTTGKPMMVTVKINASAGYAEAYCDTATNPGTSVATAGNGGGGSVGNSLTFWVLPNYYYKVVNVVGATLAGWIEWY
jgi:hypothetical protein